MHDLARELGAVAHHIFMLVRVGRGRELDAEVPPPRQEKVLNWLFKKGIEKLKDVSKYIVMYQKSREKLMRLIEEDYNLGIVKKV